MQKLLVIAISMFCPITCIFGQKLLLQKEITADVATFSIDNLDNVYILSMNNQLRKINDKGEELAVFNEVKKYGIAATIDAGNPLKTLLYYPEFLTVVALDRLLAYRNAIDLKKAQILQASSIALAYDNKVWVYDEAAYSLKRVDDNGTVVQESSDFRQLFGKAVKPQMVVDHNKLVYVYDSAHALYIFDYFGSLKNTLLLTGMSNLSVNGDWIYGAKNNKLILYNTRTFAESNIDLPTAYNGGKLLLNGNKLYVLIDEKLLLFKVD